MEDINRIFLKKTVKDRIKYTNIELLQKEFYKFVNVEKADYIVDSCNESLANKVGIVEKSKNEIYGCSNVGTVLLTSDINLENCTKRQSEFERQYLYQYIYKFVPCE